MDRNLESYIAGFYELFERFVEQIELTPEEVPVKTIYDMRVVSVNNGFILYNGLEEESFVCEYDAQFGGDKGRIDELKAFQSVLFRLIGAFNIYKKHNRYNLDIFVENVEELSETDSIREYITNMVDPYPESVFPEYSDTDMEKIEKVLEEGGFSLARLGGNIGRTLFENIRKLVSDNLPEREEIE